MARCNVCAEIPMCEFSGISLRQKMGLENYFLLAEKLPLYWTIASTPALLITQAKLRSRAMLRH